MSSCVEGGSMLCLKIKIKVNVVRALKSEGIMVHDVMKQYLGPRPC